MNRRHTIWDISNAMDRKRGRKLLADAMVYPIAKVYGFTVPNLDEEEHERRSQALHVFIVEQRRKRWFLRYLRRNKRKRIG